MREIGLVGKSILLAVGLIFAVLLNNVIAPDISYLLPLSIILGVGGFYGYKHYSKRLKFKKTYKEPMDITKVKKYIKNWLRKEEGIVVVPTAPSEGSFQRPVKAGGKKRTPFFLWKTKTSYCRNEPVMSLIIFDQVSKHIDVEIVDADMTYEKALEIAERWAGTPEYVRREFIPKDDRVVVEQEEVSKEESGGAS